MLNTVYHQVTDQIGDFNPQLFREIKGRLIPRNIIIVTTLSLISQFILFFLFKIQIQKGEYCIRYGGYCPSNLQPWWFDIFITMSVIGIFALLVIGSYMLSNDLLIEKKRGTLNFIRLSPTSATNIFIGKILGVPILLYLFALIALPFHFLAALMAKIPFLFIVSFYLVLALSCIFFYSLAILISLVDTYTNVGQQWFVSVGIFFFLWITTSLIMTNYSSLGQNSFSWLIFFSPTTIFSYINDSQSLTNMSFYTINIWQNPCLGIGFILANYSVGIYFVWQGLQRLFNNPNATIISKKNSYWFSFVFIFISMGFTLGISRDNYSSLDEIFNINFTILQIFNLILFVSLIGALTVNRQTLQDWSRYRHENNEQKYNLFKDLLFNEKSPAPLAVTLNITLVTIYSLVFALIFSVEFTEKIPILISLIFLATISISFAVITQLIRMRLSQKRSVFLSELVLGLIGIPILIGIGFVPSMLATMLLQGNIFHYILLAFVGQITVISLLSFQLKKSLKKMGMSETYQLLQQQKFA